MTCKSYTGRANINIYHGDCMEFMKDKPAKYWDLAICDPPYGINADREHREGHGWVRREQKGWDFDKPNEEYFTIIQNKSNNQIVWGGNYFTNYLPPSMGWILWDKGQRNFSLADGELAWTSMNKALRIFNYSRGLNTSTKSGFHPTEKPVALYKWLLTNYAKQGDKILDTHGGSMSIAIACWDLGFDLDIIELDKDYYDKAVQRFERHINQKQIF
jgi:site-specific DNA-methyltransferase (adenine-specific)